MWDLVVIGDGPGGLSAALFAARGGLKVQVFGKDKTAMHWAQLNNYLGLPSTHGSDFQRVARTQAREAGAELVDQEVSSIQRVEGGFKVVADDGSSVLTSELLLSEGKGPKLALSLGLNPDADGAIAVDRNGLSDVPGVYVVGRSTRPGRSQAIISAGDGAAAAIDMLSRRAGKAVCDWDSPPQE